jgi:hypothetical protein
MITAFVLISRRGGWKQAMAPDAQGRWPLPRYLMFIGALLGAIFPLLMFIPGVVPWWDDQQLYRGLPLLGGYFAIIIAIFAIRRSRPKTPR